MVTEIRVACITFINAENCRLRGDKFFLGCFIDFNLKSGSDMNESFIHKILNIK